MNNVIYVSIAGILALILLLIFRAKGKKSSISRMCLNNFLGDLAKGFEKAKLKHITKYVGPKRTDDQIATAIANELSESLAAQLLALLSNLQEFKKKQQKTFSTDDDTNHFIDKMILNLALLYTQYKTRTWIASLDNCKVFLFKITRIKILEVVKNEQ